MSLCLLSLLVCPAVEAQEEPYYALQIASFEVAKINPFQGDPAVKCSMAPDSLFRCYWGHFPTYHMAKANAEQLKSRGFIDAFVVYLFDGARYLVDSNHLEVGIQSTTVLQKTPDSTTQLVTPQVAIEEFKPKSQVAKSALYFTGSVMDDSLKTPVPYAHVKLSFLGSGSGSIHTTTDENGQFKITTTKDAACELSLTSLSYAPKTLTVDCRPNFGKPLALFMQPEAYTLDLVIVTGLLDSVEVLTDTVEFNVSRYLTELDQDAKDIVEKLPGITVENGKVFAHGRPVSQIYVDGKGLFDFNAELTLDKIPAKLIDKVQIIDGATTTATGDQVDSKIMNLVTIAPKSIQEFGQLQGGYGTDQKYSVAGDFSRLGNRFRTTAVLEMNNINQDQFTSIASNENGLIEEGVDDTYNGGVDLKGTWSRVNLNLGYLARSKSRRLGVNSLTTYIGDEQFTAEEWLFEQGGWKDLNHEYNLSTKVKLDSLGRQSLTCKSAGFRSNSSAESVLLSEASFDQQQANHVIFNSGSSAHSYGTNSSIGYQYASDAKAKGRYTAGLTLYHSLDNYQKFDSTDYKIIYHTLPKSTIDQLQRTNIETPQQSVKLAAYNVIPITRGRQFRIGVGAEQVRSAFDRLVNVVGDVTVDTKELSGTGKFRSNQAYGYGRYLWRMKHTNLSAGVRASVLAIDNTFDSAEMRTSSHFNLLPDFKWKTTLTSGRKAQLKYSAKQVSPEAHEMNSTIDNSDPTKIRIGNPFLVPEHWHNINASFGRISSSTGASFSVHSSAKITANYIGQNSFTALTDTAVFGVSLIPSQRILYADNVGVYQAYFLRVSHSYTQKAFKIDWSVGTSARVMPSRSNGIFIETKNVTASGTFGAKYFLGDRAKLSYRHHFSVISAKSNSTVGAANLYLSHVINASAQMQLLKHLFVEANLITNWIEGLNSVVTDRLIHYVTASANYTFWNERATIGWLGRDLLNQNKGQQTLVEDFNLTQIDQLKLVRFFMLTGSLKF